MSELDPSAPAATPDPSAIAPPPPALPLAPVAARERIELIDVLRGMALFGILAANIRGFAGPAATYFMPHLFWPALNDRIAQAFIDTFIQGKFITIFATLFGVGFGVQTERALSRGGKFNWTWARRCLVLLAFGLVHGILIWFGDILLVYALTGLLLLPFKRRENRTLKIWAIVMYLVPVLLMLGAIAAAQMGATPPPEKIPTAAAIEKTRELFSNGTWLAIEKARANDVVSHNWLYFPFFFWEILGLFLTGLLLYRRGFFTPSLESIPRYRRLMAWTLPLGIAGNAAIVAMIWIFKPSPMPTTPLAGVIGFLHTFAVPCLSLGYICLVVVLFHSAKWHGVVHRFAAIGRTAFSNYLLQSVLGTLIFYSYGLGFFGQVGPALLLPMTIVIFAIQVAISRWWLTQYRFGPMEWVWRRLTYGGPLPMRRELPAAVPEEAAAAS